MAEPDTNTSETATESLPVSPGDAFALVDLPRNQCGVVSEIDAANSDLQRLQLMGVCVGRRVVVVKHGDPMIIQVLGARLGLSRVLAEQVQVVHAYPMSCNEPGCEPAR